MSTDSRTRTTGQLWPAFYMLAIFVSFAFALYPIDGGVGQVVMLSAIGVIIGVGFLVHARAGPRRKNWGRRLSLALVGSSLFLGAGVFGRQSFQLEGFFFYALAGAVGGVVVHYAVAKLVGPLFFGRAWCGWGCWVWMILDYLPFPNHPVRGDPRWAWLRTAHFVASFGLVATLALGFGYVHGTAWATTDGLAWFLGGNALYLALGIPLAAALGDKRAFCKYACPVSVLLRLGSPASLLKVEGDGAACGNCRACTKACPMGVDVSSLVALGRRVDDPECVLCQSCVGVCPRSNLSLSLGLGSRARSTPPSAPGAAQSLAS